MLSSLPFPLSKTLGFGVGATRTLPPLGGRGRAMRVSMRDRGKNRKPLQRGRNLSIEAIQAVQALKRAKMTSGDAVDRVMEQRVRRLLKFDLMAVLGELQRQNEGLLALQVFEEVRKEHWYKPRFSVYAEMIRVMANNGLLGKVELLRSYLKMESFRDDTEGFNALLGALLEFKFSHTAMDCYGLMKLWDTEPDKSTFRMLIGGLETNGELEFSATIREEAKKYYGSLYFLEETDDGEPFYSAQVQSSAM